MKEKYQWYLNKVQHPAGCHLSLTVANCKYWKEFVNGVNECVAEMKKNPSLNNTSEAATYGAAEKVPD